MPQKKVLTVSEAAELLGISNSAGFVTGQIVLDAPGPFAAPGYAALTHLIVPSP